MSASKTSRWLDLLAYLLQHRFPVTREEIYRHVAAYRADFESAADDRAQESLRRKFERDKDELRELGITIESITLEGAPGDEANTGYRLRERDFYLPYLVAENAPGPTRPYPGLKRLPLEKGDIALLDRATRRVAQSGLPGLAEAATSARRKLEFDLSLPLHAIERVLSRPLTGDAARSLDTLQRAVQARNAVGCRYFAIGRDQDEERLIEPFGLFFSWGRWYVAAFSRERKAMRVFRVDRMRDAELLRGAEAAFEVPESFNIRDYGVRAPWELSDAPPVAVEVRFTFPDSRWVLAEGIGNAVDEMLDDGGAVIAFAVRDRGPFLRWLLTFGPRAQVLSPDEVAAALAELRGRVAALYAEAK
ncbi:MAG TPA: WYL domain-containing protein [Gemmatimonadales bacterium]